MAYIGDIYKSYILIPVPTGVIASNSTTHASKIFKEKITFLLNWTRHLFSPEQYSIELFEHCAYCISYKSFRNNVKYAGEC